jgi:molecular chaperone DnaJ
MERRGYYELLGVKRTSSRIEIRRAYRKLARKYHPEINPGDRVAELRYRRITEAYEVLSDPNERDAYDRTGARRNEELPEPAVGYGFEGFDFSMAGRSEADVFPEIFRRRQPVSPSKGVVPGEDLQHRMSISFDESLKGLRTSFQVNRLIACESCEGWGHLPANSSQRCRACQGRGQTTQARGYMLFTRVCPDCDGSGSVDRQDCPDCQGTGRASRQETVTVEIPPGVDDGSKVVVPGRGNEGRGGGRTGDLYVLIQVVPAEPHPFFTRKGDNLFCTVPVTFTEAALGCRVEVPTVEGTVKVRVPAGVQSGQKLRLAGRGAPSLRGGVRGDLFVTIQVVTPTAYDARSQELLRELARLHPDDPRRDLVVLVEKGKGVLR